MAPKPFKFGELLSHKKLNRSIQQCRPTFSGAGVNPHQDVYRAPIRLHRQRVGLFVPNYSEADPGEEHLVVRKVNRKEFVDPNYECVEKTDYWLSGLFCEVGYCYPEHQQLSLGCNKVYFPMLPIWHTWAIPAPTAFANLHFGDPYIWAYEDPHGIGWISDYVGSRTFFGLTTCDIGPATCVIDEDDPPAGYQRIFSMASGDVMILRDRHGASADPFCQTVTSLEPVFAYDDLTKDYPIEVRAINPGDEEIPENTLVEIERTGFGHYKISTVLCNDYCEPPVPVPGPIGSEFETALAMTSDIDMAGPNVEGASMDEADAFHLAEQLYL